VAAADAARVVDRRETQAAAARDAGMGTAEWTALGTTAQLIITEPVALHGARALVEQQLAAIDHAASRFRDDSELSRLNAAGGDWVDVSPMFARALRVAIDAAKWTGGLVDPTTGAALIALGYDRTFVDVAPDGATSEVKTGPAPGWWTIDLDQDGRRARVPAGVRVDLGATAKGLAADLCAVAAADRFGCGVLVSLGGDISTAGMPPEGGWPVTVTDLSDLAQDDAGAGQVIALHSGGLATSSSQARRWRRGGSQLHHLIDPRSGLPSAGPWRTVSVAAQTCTLANTASTAAMILGTTAPTWLAARGFSARLVLEFGAVVHLGQWPIEGERP
jgi:thiamine biosynthesis lipoprotein